MIPFLQSDPYPLVNMAEHSYLEVQEHAEKVDQWLGIEVESVEKCLSNRGCRSRATGALREQQQLWIGLSTRSLLTPYIELRNILEHLKPPPGSTVVDLGAGYGRLGFVVGRHFPEVNFVGYEYVGERIKEGRRCIQKFDFTKVKLEHADLSSLDFVPVSAEYYFIYDFGSQKAITKTLHDLRRLAQSRAITVVGRGRHSRDLIERQHPWLSDVASPEHRGTNSIYRSAHDL